MTWETILKAELEQHVQKALEAACDKLKTPNLPPYVGDHIYKIMAEAAIFVLRGIEDAQQSPKLTRLANPANFNEETRLDNHRTR